MRSAPPDLVRYYHADGLGSTRLLTDESATPTDHYAYHAFGEIDTTASQQNSDNNFLFTGEQLDPNSGFYYLRARYMNPGGGRFTQQDEFLGIDSEPQSINKYLYGNGDPANRIDPSGNVSLGESLTAMRVAFTNALRASFNYARAVAGRVNGQSVPHFQLSARLWLNRTVSQVGSKLPNSWGRGALNKKKPGWRWHNGKKDGVRVDMGSPAARDKPFQMVDHVVIRANGRIIGRNGKPINGTLEQNPSAHIPLAEWAQWTKWFHP